MDLGELKRLIREIVGANPNLPISGVVTSVGSEVCSVQVSKDLVLTDVKLKATISESENFVMLVPKVGSDVLLLSLTGDLKNLCVIKVNEAEKIHYQQDGLEVIIDSNDGKVSVKNDQTSLVTILSSLASLLKALKVMTNDGPSGVPLPDTQTAIAQFETDFNQILK
jgi:hypothetical protein